MWHTPRGDRVLMGKERSLFIHGAAGLLDHLLDESGKPDPDPDYPWHTGVTSFDRLDALVQVALLRELVQALTDPASPIPKLTAANEAAVYAVFRFIRDEIEVEVESRGDTDQKLQSAHSSSGSGDDLLYWRTLVLDAYRETLAAEAADRNSCDDLDSTTNDMEVWWCRLEVLANQILWDRDWELEELIVDDLPERADWVKDNMGISRDYFVAMPTLLRDAEVPEAVSFVRQLAEEDRDDRNYTSANLK